MPSLNVGQTGKLRSTPKICRINGDDSLKVVYRNMGNNHAYPMVWADTVVVASGTAQVLIASGVSFHGMELASYASITATPQTNPGNFFWIERNASLNTLTLKIASTASSDIKFDIIALLGLDPDISAIYCRGNNGASQSLP